MNCFRPREGYELLQEISYWLSKGYSFRPREGYELLHCTVEFLCFSQGFRPREGYELLHINSGGGDVHAGFPSP